MPIIFYLIVFSLFRHRLQVLARRVVLSGKEMMRQLFGFPGLFSTVSMPMYVGARL